MSLFTICNISLWCPQNVSEVSAQNTLKDHLLYNFENAYFEWKQNHCCSRPLSRIELRNYSSYLLKTSVLVLIIMFIMLKSCVLNHISLKFC